MFVGFKVVVQGLCRDANNAKHGEWFFLARTLKIMYSVVLVVRPVKSSFHQILRSMDILLLFRSWPTEIRF